MPDRTRPRLISGPTLAALALAVAAWLGATAPSVSPVAPPAATVPAGTVAQPVAAP